MEEFKKETYTKITNIISKLKDQRYEYVQKDKESEDKITDKINLLRRDHNTKFEITNNNIEKCKNYVTEM